MTNSQDPIPPIVRHRHGMREIELAYIGRALHRLIVDVASLRDEMHVLTAIVLRHDREFERLNTKLDDMLRQLRAMVAQHQRTGERVRQLEEQR